MGNRQSKKGKNKGKRPHIRTSQSLLDLVMKADEEGHVMSERKFDQDEVAKMKKELDTNPQLFVLNNLLMSVMFFENYEREKHRFMHSSRTTLEKELNPTLLRDQTTECIIPDIIFESVNKNIRFQRQHGPNKNKNEPLAPRRIFVVNDNIEVLESKHTPQYSAIDKPSYQVVVQESQNSGFVKLKCAPIQARPIAKPDEPVEREPQPGPSSNLDSDEYDYTTIKNINTPKPLNITSYERRDTLPKSCFAVRKVKKYEEVLQDSDEEPEEEPQEKPELYESIQYISSHEFMTYFQNAVFPNSLGKALGFDESEINQAKAIPGKIFCNQLCNQQEVDDDLPLLPCEVIPSAAIQWPITFTFEFHSRSERPTMWDKFQKGYRWPEDYMIKEISGLSCVLIPRGYTPKRGTNEDSEIEWEIGFPKAQRYLDTHMNHPQVKAFLFLLTLYKSYIEPDKKEYHGLLVDHIRTHMYWECENNPRDWPEHRLGSRMVFVIRNFNQRLAKSDLPDFFLKKKNMFSNVPNKYLTFAQKVFHNVLQNPALYFLGALRQVKYISSKFYPRLDFNKLYTILTAQNALVLSNPKLQHFNPPNLKPKNRKPVAGDVNYRREIRWKMNKEKQNREKILQKKMEKQHQQQKDENLRRASQDSIDYEWECEKKFDTAKIHLILIFFIQHFIQMAKVSRRLATQRQALFYLKYSSYLAKLLELYGLETDSRDFLEIITREEDTSKKISVTESFEFPPSTPKRNSQQFNFGDITQELKGGNRINWNNITKSYNNPSVPSQNLNKLKKTPSNLKRKTSFAKNNNFEDRRISTESNIRRSVVEFSESVEIR